MSQIDDFLSGKTPAAQPQSIDDFLGLTTQKKRSDVPDATAGSAARDIASGALQIGPTVVKGVADIARMATGDAIGKDTSEAMDRGMASIRDIVGSERAAAQRANFQADMADDDVGIGETLMRNKGALADQLLPTIGSMFLPVGVAGAAGKLATAGKAAQAMDKAALAARVVAVQKAAGIGTVAAQNAADTFAELVDKGTPMEDAYLAAGITVPFSVVAGKLTGGGAEGAITRALTGAGAAKAGIKQFGKAAGQEGAQEMGEELGQITGESVGTGEAPSLMGAAKQMAVAGTLGAVMGGGVDAANQMGQFGRQGQAAPANPPAEPPVTPPAQPGTTGEGAGASQPTQAAPTTAADPVGRMAELELLAEQRDLTPVERQEAVDLLTTLNEQDAPQGTEPAAQAPEAAPVEAPAPEASDGAPAAGVPAEPAAAGVEAAGVEADQTLQPAEPPRPTDFWSFARSKGFTPSQIKIGTPEHAALKAEYDAVKAGPDPILPPMQQQPSVDLQNRDRGRAASVVQMSDIARNPDYMRLGPSRTPDSGAPMVFAVGDQLDAIPQTNFGRDDVAVMSDGQRVPFRYAVVDATKVNPSNFADGRSNPVFNVALPGTIKALNNGRTAGVRASHEMGTAQEYVKGMQADEGMHGIPADVIARTPNPMLVRVYSDVDNTSGMAAKSQGQGLDMSPEEYARQDAPLYDSTVLGVYAGGDVNTAANRDFVRAVIGKLQAAGQPVGGMMAANGELSPTGLRRIQAGLMQAAYGDADLVTEMFGSIDTDIKAIGEALKSVAGQWANMRDSARLGAINPETDITENMIQAIGLIRKARREGHALFDLVNQPDLMTGEPPNAMTVNVLRLFYTGKYMTRPIGKERLTQHLNDYVQGAMATSADAGMFGDVVSPADVLNAIIAPQTQGDTNAETQPEESREQPAGSVDPGRSAGESGAAVARPGAGEGGNRVAANRGTEQGQDANAQAQQQVGQGDQGAAQGQAGAERKQRGKPKGKTSPVKADAPVRTLNEDGRATDGKPIMPGDVFATLSGRQTTAYPKQTGQRYASQWLIENALAEAQARGDDFNASTFGNTKPMKDGTLATADRESMLMYLFGEQPAVVPSILKPLSSEKQKAKAITPDDAANLGRGDIVRDSKGVEYYAWSARFGRIDVMPLKDGKPVVYAGSAIRFALDDATRTANPEYRTDPLYLVSKAEQAQEPAEPLLTAPTAEKILARQEAAEAAKREKEAADRKADAEEKARQEREEVRRRSEAAADTFELGQDPMENLTGQQDIFGAPAEPEAPAVSANSIFTEDAAAKARARLKAKLGRLNSGIDPEMMMDGITLAGYHIEKGARTFAAYARAMLADLGDDVRPYLKSWYMGVKYDPRAGSIKGLDDAATVEATDVEALSAQENEDVPSADTGVERDSEVATAEQAVGGATQDEPGGTAAGNREAGGQASRGDGRGQSDSAGFQAGSATPGGERSDFSVPGGNPSVVLADIATGAQFSERGSDIGLNGISPDPIPAKQVDAVAQTGTQKLTAETKQKKVQPGNVIAGDLDNIRQTLPYLLPGQQEDVAKAEQQFAKPDGYGMLFTNGTGTGKTFTGLGVVKRFALQGKTNTLIVVPDDKIAADWIESGKALGLSITKLKDTKDAGQGIVVTSYANLGENDELARRQWDLVVPDEAHTLMQSADGTPTGYLKALRGITLHPDGAYQRHSMLYRDDINRLSELNATIAANTKILNNPDTMDQMLAAVRAENEKLKDEADKLSTKLRETLEKVRDEVKSSQGEKRPRAVFLSATPFAYEFTVDWAHGYLFDYNEGQPSEEGEFRGYNSGTNRERFFMQHFGYSMRYNKLNKPDPTKVDTGLLQRNFNGWLKTKGSLSGRMLDVKADYDRRFVLVDSAIGNRIDEALNWLSEKSREAKGENGYSMLNRILDDKFDYLSRRYLLEAIKATEAVPIVREHIRLGRKVVVFHDYKKGGGFNPFDIQVGDAKPTNENAAASVEMLRAAINDFRAEFKDLVEAPLGSMASPIAVFKREFPDVLLINGDEKKSDLLARYKKFQDDDTPPTVMLVQSAKNKGWSGHDTTGKHQRVLINLGQPTAPTLAIQQEGRIYRTGQVSNAIMRYMNTGTNWEKWAFATTIATRASTAENLGMGELSRALKDSFIAAFEESDAYPPGHEGEGTGGKERDQAQNNTLTAYDRAKTFYWATQKKNSKTKAQEGVDYFATPEPVGLKMAEWLDLKGSEASLEPSAGHGAIARWLPETTKRTVVEPSQALRSRLAMAMNPGEDRIIAGQFEDLAVVNKFDGIAMNPPFGVGGKTAVEHVAKAATHLRDGGRIVALIPTGPAADKRFEKWMYGTEMRAVKPLAQHPTLGPIYAGDKIKTKVRYAPEGEVVRVDKEGMVWVKLATGSNSTTAVTLSNITSAEPTGKREREVRPAEGIYMVAEIKLPQVTFERAGTAVATRIVVLEKQMDAKNAPASGLQNRDLSDITDIRELFDRLENIELPKRLPTAEQQAQAEAEKAEQEAKAKREDAKAKRAEPKAPKAANPAAVGTVERNGLELVEHVTKAGKTIKGIIRTDLTKEQAQKIDPYTWKKDGGFFIREQYLKADGGNVVSEPDAPYNATYATDLFGDPVPAPAGRPARAKRTAAASAGDVQPTAAVPGDTPAPDAEYFIRTVVGKATDRQLGTDRILTAQDAAQATAYLYRSAVERFDAIVTDKDGKPLAVVGNFKGAINQTSVYPGTVMGEAIRVPGAARIWFSHNHPSGTATLSAADVRLNGVMASVFRGSGIEPMGTMAVAGERFAFVSADGAQSDGQVKPAANGVTVPVIERELLPSTQEREVVDSPSLAKMMAKRFYQKSKGPGLMLMDSQNKVIAWVPLPANMRGALRNTGGLNALYRAVSESNAGAAIIVHGGELSKTGDLPAGISASENIAAALSQVEVRALDSIDVVKNQSAAEVGASVSAGPVFSRGRQGAMSESTVRQVADTIAERWTQAPTIVVVPNMQDMRVPEAARLEDARQRAAGATGVPRGFYHRGTVYLVADGLKSVTDAAEALFHEALGHYGLRAVFGAGLVPILDQIAMARPDLMRPKASEYGKDLKNPQHRREVAEEVLAVMAQTKPDAGFVKRAIAAIRTWLRNNVPAFKDMKLSDNDIIVNFILPAQGWVVRGEQARQANGKVAFLRAFHGSPHRFDKFSTDHMGKGEGAQAYGWGLYFAGKQEVADYYRETLAQYPVDDVLASAIPQRTYFDPAEKGEFYQAARDKQITGRTLWNRNRTLRDIDPATLQKAIDEIRAKGTGQLYEVNIPEKTEYLLWDKPLSEQPDANLMREIAQEEDLPINYRKKALHGDRTGQDFYKALSQKLGSDEAASRVLNSYGVKGIKYLDGMSRANGEGGYNYVIFSGDDVAIQQTFFSRSTLGNGQTPPPTNPWQKLKAKAMDLTSPDKIANLIYEYQDKYIDLKNLREHIKQIGGTITDLNDAYLGEELYHKRLAKRTEDFLGEELKPLLADMRARGVTLAQLEEYLHARHAPEANKVLAARNPTQAMIDAGKAKSSADVKALEMQLQRAKTQGTATKAIEQALELAAEERERWNGAQAFKGTEEERTSLSGMSDDAAQAVMDGLAPGQRQHMDALAAKVDAINAKTLDTLEKYGLMDRAAMDAWRNTYQHYVPLNRDEAHPDAVSHPIGQGFSTKGEAAKRRTGSNAKVTNILAHIAMQREAALTRGEKNNVAKKLYVMAAQNPDPEVWAVDKPPMVRTVDRETGFVRTGVDPTYKNRPNVVMVRIGGKDAAITFNERNPTAVRMAQSIKNADVGDLNAFESIVGKGTRWLASVNTQYNPVFGLINFARDVQAAILQLSTTPLKGMEKEVASNVPAALKGIYSEVRSRRQGAGRGTGQWAQLWEEMQDAGGTTGYRELFTKPEERAEALVKAINSLDRGQTAKAVHAVVDWLSDYNETMENAVRLSAYKVAIDQGVSRERAASLAKNLTVNFNRRGRQTARLGAYYAFLNAAIQGTTRMVETMRGPLGKTILYGGVALGATSTLLAMAVMGGDGDDDEDNYEKIPDFIKERSIIIPLSKEDYIAIPMPLGYHVLPNIGRKAVAMMMETDPTVSKASHMLDFGRIVLDAFNPLGGSENLGQMAAPTVMDPVVALMQNRDWTGKQIYREDNSNLDPTPGHLRTKDTASTPSKLLSEALNKVTGGTDYQPGAVSWTPDQIDYVVGQLTGGLGRELLKVNQVITAPLTGDDLPAYKIPVVGRVYGNTRGPANNAEKFYENARQLNMVENELRGRARDGGDVAEYMQEEPLTQLIGAGNSAESQLRKLRQLRREVVRQGLPGYQEDVRGINERMGEAMKDLNQEVKRVKQEARP